MGRAGPGGGAGARPGRRGPLPGPLAARGRGAGLRARGPPPRARRRPRPRARALPGSISSYFTSFCCRRPTSPPWGSRWSGGAAARPGESNRAPLGAVGTAREHPPGARAAGARVVREVSGLRSAHGLPGRAPGGRLPLCEPTPRFTAFGTFTLPWGEWRPFLKAESPAIMSIVGLNFTRT